MVFVLAHVLQFPLERNSKTIQGINLNLKVLKGGNKIKEPNIIHSPIVSINLSTKHNLNTTTGIGLKLNK